MNCDKFHKLKVLSWHCQDSIHKDYQYDTSFQHSQHAVGKKRQPDHSLLNRSWCLTWNTLAISSLNQSIFQLWANPPTNCTAVKCSTTPECHNCPQGHKDPMIIPAKAAHRTMMRSSSIAGKRCAAGPGYTKRKHTHNRTKQLECERPDASTLSTELISSWATCLWHCRNWNLCQCHHLVSWWQSWEFT